MKLSIDNVVVKGVLHFNIKQKVPFMPFGYFEFLKKLQREKMPSSDILAPWIFLSKYYCC